jgi:hypothetical protein
VAERFPVLITGTMKYVVWVEADDAEQAHYFARECEHDYVEGEQPVDGWLDAERKPSETDEFIWLYGSTFLPQHDAHVHTHRWATREAATAGGRS